MPTKVYRGKCRMLSRRGVTSGGRRFSERAEEFHGGNVGREMAMIHFRTRGGPHAAERSRRVLEAMAGDLEASVLDDVQLLTTELVNNCVKHGDAGPRTEIQLGYSTPNEMVRIEVTGPGEGFELEMPEPDPTTPHGFGLRMVDHVATRWGLSRGGCCVWFELSRGSALHP